MQPNKNIIIFKSIVTFYARIIQICLLFTCKGIQIYIYCILWEMQISTFLLEHLLQVHSSAFWYSRVVGNSFFDFYEIFIVNLFNVFFLAKYPMSVLTSCSGTPLVIHLQHHSWFVLTRQWYRIHNCIYYNAARLFNLTLSFSSHCLVDNWLLCILSDLTIVKLKWTNKLFTCSQNLNYDK